MNSPEVAPIELPPVASPLNEIIDDSQTSLSQAEQIEALHEPIKDSIHKFDSNVTICFRNVSVKLSVSKNSTARNVFSPIVDLRDAITSGCTSCKRDDLYRVKNISGIIRPGTMTLVLSAAGQGKSTYLRALSNRVKITAGKVVYNGRTFEDARKEGVDLKKMTQFVDQIDQHIPSLTCYETISFAHKMTSMEYNEQRVEDTITLLGLEECRDTILGNALIRGVSGGQKKRVTTGELLVSDASVLFLDEYSNGLDSSTAEDIAKGLKKFCQKYNSSIVATLQQPTPELFALFDRLVVLREGEIVFDGPVIDVLPHFSSMGFKCPDDVDTADFLLDCLTQPRSIVYQQRQAELLRLRKEQKAGIARKKTKKPTTIDSSYGPLRISTLPCITTESMVEHYRTTPQWREIEAELDRDLPIDGSTDNLDLSKYPSLTPTERSKTMYQLGYRLPVPTMVKYVMQREFTMLKRSKVVVIPRVGMSILMGLAYGTLYWRVSIDDYRLRLASLVIAVSQIAFGSFPSVSQNVAIAQVTAKQTTAMFFPEWIYAISSFIAGIPLSISDTVVYFLLLGFMTDVYPGGKELVLYFIILFCASLCLSSWFRFIAAASPNEALAMAIAGPSVGVAMTLAGVYISYSSIPDFMKFLYYISPFSWAARALSNVEFLSPRYDKVIPNAQGVNQRIGHIYLEYLDMFIGDKWVLIGCLYMIGFTIFSLLITIWALKSEYYEPGIGTRRIDEEEVVDEDDEDQNTGSNNNNNNNNNNDIDDDDDDDLKEQVRIAAVHQAVIQHERSQTNTQHASLVVSNYTTNNQTNTQGQRPLQTLQDNLPFTPAWMSFSDVSYTVKVEKDKQMVDRVLLNNVNGYAQPGKMLALMGASGAGKSTLLDVIAGLKNTGLVKGSIKINGQEATKALTSAMCGYVEQFDTLFPYSTVYETLVFAARLRLPRAVSDETKLRIVEEIMDILELKTIRDFAIGNQKIIGLSPAQCKRVNIGLELVANPSVLFLDEPTTGLDSKNAMTVMKVVKRIARCGRAIICTIHQPSAELFFLFDRLLLLGAGGYQIYFGDLGHRAQSFVRYLSRCPGITPIQPRVNPASWMLVELGVGVAAEKGDTNARFKNAKISGDQILIEDEPEWENLSHPQRTVQKFRKMYLLSPQYQKTIKRINVLESIEMINPNDDAKIQTYQEELKTQTATIARVASNKIHNDNDDSHSQMSHTRLPTQTLIITPNTRESWYIQLWYLFCRNFQGHYRNPPLIYTRSMSQLILSVLFGLLYYDLYNKVDSMAAAASLCGSIAMSVAFTSIGYLSSSIPLGFEARAVSLRERNNGYYKPIFLTLVHFFIEMIFTIPGVIVSVIPAYFLVGLRPEADIIFRYMLWAWVCFLAYISTAQLFIACLPHSATASVASSATVSLFNNFAGIGLTKPGIPRAWRYGLFIWLPVPNLLPGMIMPQVSKLTHVISGFQNGVPFEMPIRDYLAIYLGWDYGAVSEWTTFGYAVGYIVGMQILALLGTIFVDHSKR